MDFNAAEIVLLLMLAVIIFGPEKLPDLARKTARVLSYVRNIANDAKGQLRRELGPEFDDIRLSDLNPKAMLSKHVLGSEVEQDLRQVASDLRGVGSSAGEAGTSVPVVARPAVVFDPEAT